MGRSLKWLNGMVLVLALVLGGTTWAQEPPGPPQSGETGPEMMGPGGPGMGPDGQEMGPGHRGARGERGERGKMDPEAFKKMAALRTTAEAYKNLAELYREQGKTDEAVAQLKKILDLSNSVTDQDAKRKVADQIGNVYIAIAQIYLEKEKFADAEAILNEGVEKTKTDTPEIASRMMLTLGNLFRKAGKTAEAEKAFQRVIEINSTPLKPKK